MNSRLFLESCKSEATRKVYSVYLKRYEQDYDISITDPRQVESMVIDFIIKLKQEGKSFAAIHNYVATILSYYKINDVVLNTHKINKFMPERRRVKKDRAYTHEEISRLLSIADERIKAVILLMTSGGCRIGAIPLLRLRNLQDNKLTIYENDREEHFTFITPECKRAVDNYLDMRSRYEEKSSDDSYLIREQFDLRNPRPPKQVNANTVEKRLLDMSTRMGMRTNGVPIAHGFRKFFTTQLINSKVNPEIREMLLGHDIGLAGSYYRPTEEEMFDEYDKAVNNLTINEENRLRKKVETLEIEKSQMDRIEQKLRLLEAQFNSKEK